MNKELIKRAFSEWKKATKADYARMNVDALGDCMSCVNAELGDKYGMESKGIWLKHWNYGMNAMSPIEKQESEYIAHDITKEQAEEVYRIFGKYFHVFPEQYNEGECFELFDKSDNVYMVSYPHELNGKTVMATYCYTNEDKANAWCEKLKSYGEDAKVELVKEGERTIKVESRRKTRKGGFEHYKRVLNVFPYSMLDEFMADDNTEFIIDNESGETLYSNAR